MSKASDDSPTTTKKILDRIRAWFLITPDNINPEDVAKRIYAEWIDPQGANPPSNNLVVIRADVVELIDESPCQVTVIVPADAKSDLDLDPLKAYLQQFGTVIEARVKDYFPEAPYLSNGYISKDEAILGIHTKEILSESLGLTRTSPGDNPWG
ncbi:MAG: hypothetical protein E3J69_06065 [Anaerolineales bacterium]|nr:MAG: hypothetical protein E3J69_06065 [Anaerolineales bacterium]